MLTGNAVAFRAACRSRTDTVPATGVDSASSCCTEMVPATGLALYSLYSSCTEMVWRSCAWAARLAPRTTKNVKKVRYVFVLDKASTFTDLAYKHHLRGVLLGLSAVIGGTNNIP